METGSESASSPGGIVTLGAPVPSRTLKLKSIWKTPVVPHCASAPIISLEVSATGAVSMTRYHSVVVRQIEVVGMSPSSAPTGPPLDPLDPLGPLGPPLDPLGPLGSSL